MHNIDLALQVYLVLKYFFSWENKMKNKLEVIYQFLTLY